MQPRFLLVELQQPQPWLPCLSAPLPAYTYHASDPFESHRSAIEPGRLITLNTRPSYVPQQNQAGGNLPTPWCAAPPRKQRGSPAACFLGVEDPQLSRENRAPKSKSEALRLLLQRSAELWENSQRDSFPCPD